MDAPIAARMLGYAGLIPFITLAIVALAGGAEVADQARSSAIAYGVAILSFMGGCRWGFAAAGLGEGPQVEPLARSVAPALLGWVALILSPKIGAAGTAMLLIAGFLALYADDRRAQAMGGAPAWWTSLRLPLTAGATLSLAGIGISAL